MQRMLTRIFCLATAVHLLIGCSVLQQTASFSDTASIQNQRSANVEFALLELDEIDALIKLNNRVLSNYIEAKMRMQTTVADQYTFRNIHITFQRQFIELSAIVDILDEDKNIISASVSGEILLHFGGDRLQWFPRFTQLKIISREFEFQGNSYSGPTTEMTGLALKNLNSAISGIFIKHKNTAIPLNMAPLGEVRIGASLPGLGLPPARSVQALMGSTRIIDSVMLIDSPATTIALDLAFAAGRTPCPSGSGCTVYSETVHSTEPETLITHVSMTEARRSFAILKEEFETRTTEFSISRENPGVAFVEIRRSFLHEALQTSLTDISIDADFKVDELLFPGFSTQLRAFDTDNIMCKHNDCPSIPHCMADLTQCKRLRDARDCTSCVFRNPLNNRCVSEETDRQCESERSLQNARFDAERAACIDQVETMKRDCETTNAQALVNCQLGSDSNYSGCKSVRHGIKDMDAGASLASVSTKTKATGKLVANYSNLRIEGDLERLKLDIGLKSDLRLSGELKFTPGKLTPALTDCFTAWNTPFESRFVTMPSVNNLVSNLQDTGNELIAQWSGFGLTIHAEPAPLTRIAASTSLLLSNCNIALKPGTVKRALSGNDAAFFLGQLHMQIQPLPTTIHFSPATITLGDRVFSGNASLSSHNLRYQIGD